MESGVPNSFIPQDATVTRAARSYEASGGLEDVARLLAVVFLIASIALAAAAFLYNAYLKSQIDSKKAEIEKAQASLDPAFIQQVTRLNTRMQTASGLLNQHVAPSAFFASLNQTTLQTASFKDLTLTVDSPSEIKVKMDGLAQSVNTVALQAQLFGQTGVIQNPIFSNIDRTADGVEFSVAASVNPQALNYVTVESGQAAQGVNQLPAQTQQVQPQAPASPFEGSQSQTQPQSQGQSAAQAASR